MQGSSDITWCFPPEYEDCNNNSHGMCEALLVNCAKDEKCKFYKSRRNTSEEDMKHYHKMTWRGMIKGVD